VESGGIATSDTQLYKIAKFYDDNGNFILGTKGKYLTVYNTDGTSAKIFLDAMDTIGDVADKITNAVKNDLGMATGDENIDKHIADFVNAPVPNSDEALQGTIVIRSPKMGDSGQLFFSGDEDLLNALSLVTIHKPGAYQATVTVKDAHTGEEIGSDTISNNEVHGVIKGVDILIDPMLDTNIEWDETDKKYRFTSASGSTKEYLHIVDNAKSFQIGANKGQTMDSYIGEMSARSLNVKEILVVNQDVAQKSISILDDAIDQVSSERARLGAVINRLDFTIKNLSSQKESAISAFSRIVDLDVAKESVEFSKNQMLTQAAQSMLAQANKIPQNLLQLLR
jgi:flagellin